ncbi:hypothetical protein [Clostridium isatidis]|uniref:hypothetical protein n=1 Tax=Clostridium isatidis TaxID=182773 RepID=UPI003AB0C9BF
MSNQSYRSELSEEKIKQILSAISGLTYSQWSNIKSAVDYIYKEKATKTKFDSPSETKTVMTILKL